MFDLSYSAATPNFDTGFLISEPTGSEVVPLDAIYIPTQSHRPAPETALSVLTKAAGSVHLIFSDSPAPWAVSHDWSNVHIQTVASEDRNAFLGRFESARNPGNRHGPDYDIPYKRNLALNDSRMRGYRTIGFLDDDIFLDEAQIATVGRALAQDFDMVSFHVLDYPDVSTIDHVERLILRRPSRVSISGNCLFLRTNCAMSFFPEAYNDDWFFIFSHIGHARICSLGVARQRPYQPWNDHSRIAFEQFGDITIEGAKVNIRAGRSPFSGDFTFWGHQLKSYITRLHGLRSTRADPILDSALKIALTITRELSPQDFVVFLERYQSEAAEFYRTRAAEEVVGS